MSVPAPWRLLKTGFASGAWNMALDEAIFRLAGQGHPPEAGPTLRLYGWEPPCLSVGYFQTVGRDVDLARLAASGIDLVRRPSGGRAILHDQELTYAVVAPLGDHRVSGSVAQSYGKLVPGFVAALEALGVAAEAASQKTRGNGALRPPEADQGGALRLAQGRARSPACFATTSHYELTVGGRKVVGSAQVRQGGVLLQHGSLLLALDESRFASLLRDGAAANLRQQATSLSEALGRPVSWEEAAEAVARGFAQALGIELIPDRPTADELDLARRLVDEKYATAKWNLRR